MMRFPCWIWAGFAGLASLAVAEAAPLSVAVDADRDRLLRAAERDDAALAAALDAELDLDACLRIAMQRNLALVVGRMARDAAATRIGAAYGGYLPEITVRGGRSSSRAELATAREATATSGAANVVTRLPLGTAITAGYTYARAGSDRLPAEGPSLSVVQPLLRDAGWRAGTAGLQDARLQAAIADADLEATTLQVTFDVHAAWYEILRRRRLVEVNTQAVVRDAALVEFSRAKLEAQVATGRDVLSAEILLAQDRARLVTAEAQLQAAFDQLANVLGLRVARPLRVPAVALDATPLPVDETAWIARAGRCNPELRRAQLELERAALARDLSGNARLPRLDLEVGYDDLRSNVASGGLANAPRGRERTWQGAVSMSWPLFNRTPENDYRAARLEYERSRRLLLDAERRLALEVRDAVRNLQRVQDRIAILSKNIEGARAKVEFAKVNFQLGRASNLDVTEAQKDLLSAESEHVNELVNVRVERARLEQLLGGSL